MINKISIKRSVFSVRMKMVSTAITMITSSKSLRWCKNDFHGLNDFMQTKKRDWSSRQPFAHSRDAQFCTVLHSFAQFCRVLHCNFRNCNVLRIATFNKGSLKFAQIYWIVLLHYSLLQNSTLNSSLLRSFALHSLVLHSTVDLEAEAHLSSLFILRKCTARTIRTWQNYIKIVES